MAAIRRIEARVIATALAALAVGIAVPTPGEAAPVCRVSTISWSAPTTVLLYRGGPVTYDTGLSVPAAGVGETVSVTASAYSSYDRYPANASPSRADADQQHEQWGLRIGGTNFGLLSADVPDSIDEGAVDDWYATTSGTLGLGAVATGRIVIVHSSLYGFTESYNSVRPGSFTLTVSYCSDAPATTTTTSTTSTAPTTTAAATTTAVVTTTSAATTTTGATTTTASGGTTTTVPAVTTTSPPSQTAAPTSSTVAATTTIVATTTIGGSATTVSGSTTTDSTTTSILPLTPLPAATTTVATTTTATGGSTTVVPSGPLPNTGWNGAIFLRVGTILVAVGAVLYRLRRRALTAG